MAKTNKSDVAGNRRRSESKGLILDDCLNQFAEVRRQFRLTAPVLNLRQIEAEAGAKTTLATVIKDILSRHGSDIFSKQHPLLSELGDEIYAEPICTSVYSGSRIREDRVSQTLRRVIEVGIQTIVQLPRRENVPASVPRRLKSAASALKRSADSLSAALINPDVRRYIELLDDQARFAKILKMSSEIRCAADTLDAAAALKVKRIRMNSPNPQTSVTMSLIGWMRMATGRPHYEGVTMLIQAAFSAAGKPTPRWVERLPIEMHAQKKWRKRCINTISS
jgi:hypothetical protein